jgi:phage/plasmid-like protein (TIGR03299 family)
MPANIENNLEKTMFMSANVPAWHNLGQVVDGAQTWEQAMKAANLDWSVSKVRFPNPFGDNQIDAFGIFRDDNKQFLGQVGIDYHPIQNEEQFKFLDALMEANSGAIIETAGALGNGERLFATAKIAADFYISGTDDLHKTYLLVANSHNGSMRLTTMMTEVRVVCENTLQMALTKSGEKALRFRHTKNAVSRMREAEDLVKGVTMTSKALQEKLEVLAHRRMTKPSLKSLIEKLFPVRKGEADISKQAETKLIRILNLFEENDNDAIPQVRGTAYNMLNAFTNFVDHESRTVKTEKRKGADEEVIRADSAVFGTGSRFKNHVLDVLLETTKNAPRHTFGAITSIPSIVPERFKIEAPETTPEVDDNVLDAEIIGE